MNNFKTCYYVHCMTKYTNLHSKKNDSLLRLTFKFKTTHWAINQAYYSQIATTKVKYIKNL